MKNRLLLIITVFMACPALLFAQERKDKAPVTFEELYDEPYSINKLFVGFTPLYGELFVSNMNAGFGVEAVYYHLDKLDFRASFRKTYATQFYDFARDLSQKNSDVENEGLPFSYMEFGATYHIKDFEESSKTNMILYKNSYKGNRWASRVPLTAEVPCKVRKIYGARLGGIFWKSSVDLTRALDRQGLSNADLLSSDSPLPVEHFDPLKQDNESVDAFSNISSQGFYLGGSMAWIRNVAVSIDKFEEGVDDLMFTVYADILYAPFIRLDDVVYTQRDAAGNRTTTATYSVDPVKLQSFGFRAGLEGRFNRTLSWSYGGEIGYRPGIQGSGFFALLKVSFPVYGTNLDYKVESFGK